MNRSTIVNSIIISGIAAAIGAGFVSVDYISSQTRIDSATMKLKGQVVQEIFVYKKLNGDYATKGEGAAARIGEFINKTANLGNADTAYLINNPTLTYVTKPGIFFPSTERQMIIPTDRRNIAIVSGADIANIGDTLECEPRSNEGLAARLSGRAARTITIQDGAHPGVYYPLVNPEKLRIY